MSNKGPVFDKAPPKDGKDYWRRAYVRHSEESGQGTIHGMSLYELQTQEGQSFGFYSGTGQGGVPNGPGTGRAVLNTPGMSYEVVGSGLKAKGNEGNTSNRAKYILAKHGNIVIEAEDGDIILMGKNVRFFANGGGDDGDVTINANHIVNVKSSHDIRLQSDNTIAMTSVKEMNIVTEGFYKLGYSFAVGSAASDINFGSVFNTVGDLFSFIKKL